MTDKTQIIKQEIERRFDDNMEASEQYTENSKSRALFTSAAKEDYDLLAFIDSLPEEPKNDDLEEELHNFLIEQGPMATLERCAKHFAEWQKEKHKTQYGFLNLKDCKDAYNEWKSTQDNPSAALAWVRACEWQKQQMKETLQTEYEKGRFDMREEMMEALVDGEIIKNLNNQLCVKSEPIKNTFGEYKFGNKVKILILKTA